MLKRNVAHVAIIRIIRIIFILIDATILFEKYITIHLFISINVIRHVLSLKTIRKYTYIRRQIYGGWDSTVNSFNNFISKVLTTVITKFTVQITQFKLNRLLSSSLAIYLHQLFQMPMHINRMEKHWRIAARGNRTDRLTRISSNRRSVLCYFTETCSYEKNHSQISSRWPENIICDISDAFRWLCRAVPIDGPWWSGEIKLCPRLCNYYFKNDAVNTRILL